MLGDRGAARRALRKLAAMGARQQTGPTCPVVEAHQGPPLCNGVGIIEHRSGQAHELFREHATARIRASPIDALDRGPARSLGDSGQRLHCAPRTHDHRRARRGDDARAALPATTLRHDIDRTVGRRALLTIGLVVRIENKSRSEARERRPCGRPAPHDDRPARSRFCPFHCGQIATTHQTCAESLGPADGGNDDQDSSGTSGRSGVVDDGQHQVDEVGRRRDPQQCRTVGSSGTRRHGSEIAPPISLIGARSTRSIRSIQSVRSPRPVQRGPRYRGKPAHGALRRGHPEEEGDRSGPTPARPLGQFDHRRRRSPPRPDLQRLWVHALRRGDVVIDHPASDAATVQDGAHARADGDLVGPA